MANLFFLRCCKFFVDLYCFNISLVFVITKGFWIIVAFCLLLVILL